MDSLYQKSLQILIDNQDTSGAFLASPNFGVYRYAWLRDGAFCAYALDQAGFSTNAGRFHAWVFQVLERYQAKLQRGIRLGVAGTPPPASECFHSRYTVAGEEVPGHWGHHQLDGLGTWLWAACDHFRRMKSVPDVRQRALLELVRDYLAALWHFPCSDLWEEHEDRVHVYSLACVSAGLTAFAGLIGDPQAAGIASGVRSFIIASGVKDGHLVKSLGDSVVDASLVALTCPYRLLPYQHPIMQATLERIQQELAGPEGGLKRYAADTYYGGGEWLLLAAWLGWSACEAGDLDLARRQLAWAEAQSDVQGWLPEQVSQRLNVPSAYQEWVDRWGPVASPLLWSHAQYVILKLALDGRA